MRFHPSPRRSSPPGWPWLSLPLWWWVSSSDCGRPGKPRTSIPSTPSDTSRFRHEETLVTETTEPAVPVAAPADSGSSLGNLFNLYFEPSASFTRILVKPRLWMAILLQVAMGLLFSSIWLEKMDARE